MEYIIVIILILFSALFSGLTLGLMGLDTHVLKRKIELGDELAKKIYPLRKRGNLLLTTLLLGNVAVNATLSIFLSGIASGVIAGIMATALIFIFGEILPQAVISRFAMEFGAKTAWIVWIITYLLYPITWPIAWLLDKLLGREIPAVFTKVEFMKVIEEHEDSENSEIDQDEERILKGALTFSDRKVRDVMTPDTVVESLLIGDELTDDRIKYLKNTGYSRFPVFEPETNNVVGVFYIKELVGVDGEDELKPEDAMDRKVFEVQTTATLDDTLDRILKSRSHLFIVRDEFGGFEGIITAEDILEEIVGREIVDEYDKNVDMREVAKKQFEDRKSD
jgi:metal transporter CNNM